MDNLKSSKPPIFKSLDYSRLESKHSILKKDFFKFIQSKNQGLKKEDIGNFVQEIMLNDDWIIKNAMRSRDILVFTQKIDEDVFRVVSLQINSGSNLNKSNEFFCFPTPTVIQLRTKNNNEFLDNHSINNLEFMIEDFYLSEFFKGSRSAEGICSKALFDPKIQPYTQKYYSFKQSDHLVREMTYICHHISEVFLYAFRAIRRYLIDRVDLLTFTSSSIYQRNEDRFQIYAIDEFSADKMSTFLFDIPNYSKNLKFETKENESELLQRSEDYLLGLSINYQHKHLTISVTRDQLPNTLCSLTNKMVSQLIMEVFLWLEPSPAFSITKVINETDAMRQITFCMAWHYYD